MAAKQKVSPPLIDPIARPMKLATIQELTSNTEEYSTDLGLMKNCKKPISRPIPNEIGISIHEPPNPHGVTMADENAYRSTHIHLLNLGFLPRISSKFPLASSTPIRSCTTAL
ncbi:hypothetical protein OGAPHI_005692 [Ogataea philodendri]|uniref:Uncharacterized protein n=1 Tax=Ogataea philodendri TaxID=1378263 RepID=A0A9P8NZP0_9ASCO|nr:uncharacterized protein OGAPHI_005692 [Ogataea philodendri]KAH3662440.1 hypothetical protein OGAPHI_005692 [Ogataea philodendri]